MYLNFLEYIEFDISLLEIFILFILLCIYIYIYIYNALTNYVLATYFS